MQRSYKIKIVMSAVSLICLLITLSYPNSATPLSIIPIIATVAAWLFNVDFRFDYHQAYPRSLIHKLFSGNATRIIFLVIAMVLLISCAFIGFTHEIVPENKSVHYSELTSQDGETGQEELCLDEISDSLNSLDISEQSKSVINSILTTYSSNQYVIEPKKDFAFPFLTANISYNIAALVVFLIISFISVWEVIDSVLASNTYRFMSKLRRNTFSEMVNQRINRRGK